MLIPWIYRKNLVKGVLGFLVSVGGHECYTSYRKGTACIHSGEGDIAWHLSTPGTFDDDFVFSTVR